MPDYVELRAASAFSFLRGASLPEDLVAEAARLGHGQVALGDRGGVYGAPRFFRAAREAGIRPLVGAELALENGATLYVLVQSRRGYRNLCRLLTESKLRAEKGEDRVAWSDLEPHAEGLLCLAGGDDGPLHGDASAVRDAVRRLRAIFPDRVYVDLQRHLDPAEERRNRHLADLAADEKLPLVATNDVRHATKRGRALLDVLTAIREKTTLDAAGRRLAANAERHLKPADVMEALFRDLPEAIRNTRTVAERCEFTLADLGYRFPDYPLPPGETPDQRLRALAFEGAARRYDAITPRIRAQLDHELAIIEKLGLAGYFLIVWDVVEFCRREGILAQGRGSAANSAVCYCLGITAVDAIGMDLLFERFLSEERGEWPDIDIDLPSGDRRERVIQHVYERYGERGAAMTANVITYRPRSAAREIGKVLGFSETEVDRLSRCLREHGYRDEFDTLAAQIRNAGFDAASPRVRQLVRLAGEIQGLPRHLGQHSGGMVIAAGRLDEVVPLERARMPGRVVVQWDKEDCADLGIIKVDLLGLGMMAVLEDALPLVREHEGVDVDLGRLPTDDPAVYESLRRADTIGVFQVESRAQMATLPRLRPERFYDLVVEVAIIRPGPIVGEMVHPYLNRRAGREPVTYAHPALQPILERTLGVPLFQEQLLRMAMAVAGFTPGEAEELRRAMSFKRSVERMHGIESRLRAGMARNGIVGKKADEIVQSITSFALYGFPESHAASFALLAYASAYLKVHHPAAFLCAMLNNWPLGFYHPATLVKDAQRHGVPVLPIDVAHSGWSCTIDDGALRLGLRYVKSLREQAGKRIEAERAAAPFVSIRDFARRTDLRRAELDTLAHLGAFASLGYRRREALWQVAAVPTDRDGLVAGVDDGERSSPLPPMTAVERTLADYRASEMTVGPHVMRHLREALRADGILSSAELRAAGDGRWVKVAGQVIVRQRPGTAKGFLFLTLEDETGTSNAVVTPRVFERHRALLQTAPLLLIEGYVQNVDDVIHVRGRRFEALAVPAPLPQSRDFR
ncbi:MAG: error-prone polymerase [Candidatus Binatota bacterium]|nr:error-prone polymerase [Candidatus Binatota bacterium]